LRTIPLVVVVFAFVLSACQESTVGPSAASRELATEGEVMLGTVEGLTMSSADVVAGFNCAVGIFGGYPRVFTTDSHITKSNGGKMTLTCHGLLPEGVGPEKAEVQRSEDFPGRRCRVFSTTATRWQQVFTPSGEISLKCQVK
jgi:hypothetical protein